MPLLLAPWESGSLEALERLGIWTWLCDSLSVSAGASDGEHSWPPQSHDKARGPMSGELPGKQGDGIDNSPLRQTLPDGSEAGPAGHPTPDRAHLGSEIVAAVRRHEINRVAPAQGEPQAPDRRAGADEERPVVSFAARAPMSTSICILRRGFGSCRRNTPTTFV